MSGIGGEVPARTESYRPLGVIVTRVVVKRGIGSTPLTWRGSLNLVAELARPVVSLPRSCLRLPPQ
jgi:hypothetical protein